MYLGFASIIALFIVITLSILRKFVKKILNKKVPNINHLFVEDTLIDTKIIQSENSKISFSTNKIFQVNRSISKKIKRYVISKNKKNLSLLYEYGEKVNRVNMLIYFYNKNRKLIYIFKVEEEVKSSYSKQINIPKNTSYVNFVDYNNELETYYNKQIIRDRNLLIYDSISVFLIMFFISYWTVFILGGNILDYYFDLSGIIINFLLILILTILNFTMNLNIIQKRNP